MLDHNSTVGQAVVIGAGTMGGGIAAQLANAGWQVTLLDITDKAAGIGLERLQSARPPLLFLPEFAERIRIGNMADASTCLREADWVVEAVAEKMTVKQAVMAQIESQVGPETVVSSNTSGLSLREMIAGRSPAFQRRFLGSHFLNPPRYLKLLEVIPVPETDPEIARGFADFAEQVLGHRVVFARDTPGFISTRIGIWHLLDSIGLAFEHGLTVEEADALTGVLIGRPRSGTFRLADIVGLDILAAIASDQYQRLPDDPYRSRYLLPEPLARLPAAGQTGDKVGAGFYKRVDTQTLALDLQTLEYRPRQEAIIPEIQDIMRLPLSERFAVIAAGERSTPALRFLNDVLDSLSTYVAYVSPQIADDMFAIDRVMRWGFGWEMGPFEIIAYRTVSAESNKPALMSLPADSAYLSLRAIKASGGVILESPEATLLDLGESVACLEFHTKMNTFTPMLTAFVDRARERAEQGFAGLVIGNEAAHFSAGYNLKLFLECIASQQWSAIDNMLREVQFAFLRLKYAKIPVIAAPHGFTLGAGCECVLHCAAVQAAPELAIGLPEAAAGIVPAGGGTKEMLARAMADWDGREDALPRLGQVFTMLAFPRTSGSAAEAQNAGFLRVGDRISRNADRQLFEAKQWALNLAEGGYNPPAKSSIWVLGKIGLEYLQAKIDELASANSLSAFDRQIAESFAGLLSGGNLPQPQEVSEEWILQREREVFIELAHEPKSRERMQHVLATGKPLKN